MAAVKLFAARIGDPVTHDFAVPSGMIGPPPVGTIGVVIEHAQAAVLGCTVTCTGLTAAGVAHPPGPAVLIGGSTTVFIHGRPAARWSPAADTSSCGALLGDPRLLAVRTVEIGG